MDGVILKMSRDHLPVKYVCVNFVCVVVTKISIRSQFCRCRWIGYVVKCRSAFEVGDKLIYDQLIAVVGDIHTRIDRWIAWRWRPGDDVGQMPI